nr:MarR family transcriptional regulator [Lactobacillus colini]
MDKADFNLINERLKPYNLSNIQALIIIYLFNNPNSKDIIKQKDLEIAFGVTNPTMTISLKSMIKKGLIIKERSNLDKRVYALNLTTEGKNLYPKCLSIYTEVEAIYASILTKEEITEFTRISNKIINFLKKKH